jgi:hypothetical protein
MNDVLSSELSLNSVQTDWADHDSHNPPLFETVARDISAIIAQCHVSFPENS